MAKVLTLILNYRTARLTLECVDSLRGEQGPRDRLLVVDNGSPVEEVAALRDGLGLRASFLGLDKNYGFAGGINRALRRVGGEWDYLWLLNSDTRVQSGARSALVEALEASPGSAAAGSRLDNFGELTWQGAFAFPSLVSEWERGAHTQWLSRWLGRPTAQDSTDWLEPTPVDWLPGASLLIRRQAWEQIGKLNEAYFLYFEDVEWGRRAAAKGWTCLYVPSSRVSHHVGGSSPPGTTPPSWFSARRRYWVEHHGLLTSWVADAAWLMGRGTAWLRGRTREALRNEPRGLLKEQWRDHVKSWRGFSTGSAESASF